MQFGDFLGNERLKERLLRAFQKQTVSHCYLISGPEGSGKKTLARALSAALQCTGETPPCGNCTACRKALAGIHPDVITVDDPEKRTVPIDLIRSASADAMIRPNEGRRKIYLIPRASDMLAPAQNALLKIIEEPPPYGVFLLLAENPDILLPTVRSRCVELSLQPLSHDILISALRERTPEATPDQLTAAAAASEGWLGRAIALVRDAALPESTEQFAAALASGDALRLLETTTAMEKWKRPDLEAELQRMLKLVTSALAVRSGISAANPSAKQLAASRSARDLMRAADVFRLALDYVAANVGTALICAMLSVRLR